MPGLAGCVDQNVLTKDECADVSLGTPQILLQLEELRAELTEAGYTLQESLSVLIKLQCENACK